MSMSIDTLFQQKLKVSRVTPLLEPVQVLSILFRVEHFIREYVNFSKY